MKIFNNLFLGSGLEEQEVYNISLTLEARTGGSNLKKVRVF